MYGKNLTASKCLKFSRKFCKLLFLYNTYHVQVLHSTKCWKALFDICSNSLNYSVLDSLVWVASCMIPASVTN